ncbi:MAG: YbhN family protein [Microthrixaceae bacterium]
MPSGQQPEPDPTAVGNTRRAVLAAGITVIVLAVVFAGILPKFGDYGDAWNSVTRMSGLQLTVLAVVVAISIVVYVFPLQASLPGLRYWPAFMTRQTSFTISNAVPAGGAVGLGVQYSMLSGVGASGPAITAAIAIVAVFNLFMTLALPVLGVAAMFQSEAPSTAQIAGAVAGLALVIVLVVLFAVVLRSEKGARRVGETLDRGAARLPGRLRRPESSSGAQQLVAFRDSTVEVVRRRWVSITISSFVQQLAQFAVLLVALRVTESNQAAGMSVLSAFAAFSLARLAGFIPITPGGLGTVDAGLVSVLVTLGSSRGDALAATLLWRAASWVPQVVIGLITLVLWRLGPRGSGRGGKGPSEKPLGNGQGAKLRGAEGPVTQGGVNPT